MSESRITRVGLGESVQAAIDNASAGDTIVFSFGEKRLIIDKPAHLVGVGMDIGGWRGGCVFYDDGAIVLPNDGKDSAGSRLGAAMTPTTKQPAIDIAARHVKKRLLGARFNLVFFPVFAAYVAFASLPMFFGAVILGSLSWEVFVLGLIFIQWAMTSFLLWEII